MKRAVRIASLCIAIAVAPAGAEAAKSRFRGTSFRAETAEPEARGSRVVVPAVESSNRPAAVPPDTQPRVPFPTVAAGMPRETEPPLRLRLSANADDTKIWCRSDVVVGGFCVLN